MIRYNLKCHNGHAFDSWFHSADGFDAIKASGHLTCPTCGESKVDKAIMAPSVQATRSAHVQDEKADLTTPASDKEKKLAELRRKIEAESDYVGLNFAAEARAMHEGERPFRSIYGEARMKDAKKLVEDGIPVAPLPFVPKARAN